MAALRFDLAIDQGSDYQVVFPVLDPTGQPQDLTGWSGRCQARRGASDTVIVHDFTTELALVGSELRMSIPAAVSTAWAWTSASYDLELVAPSGAVTRLVEGHVLVRPEITR